MKNSIFLNKNVLPIMISKLDKANIPYEIKHQESGGNLYVDSKDIPKCSELLDEARAEEGECSEVLNTLSCEVVNKSKQDINNMPHINLVGDLAIVPIKKDGSPADQEFCTSLYRTNEEVMNEVTNHLKYEHFKLEKLGELVQKIMKEQGFEEDYIEETLQFHQAKHCPIWVLHNYPKPNGATALYADWVLKIIHSNLEENFYILPSSKHEALVIPECWITNLDALEEMLREVNKAELNPEDVLSDRALYFDGSQLIVAPEKKPSSIRTSTDIREYTELYSILLRLREV